MGGVQQTERLSLKWAALPWRQLFATQEAQTESLDPGTVRIVFGLATSIRFPRPRRHDDRIETFWIVTGREPYPNTVYRCIFLPGGVRVSEKDAHKFP